MLYGFSFWIRFNSMNKFKWHFIQPDLLIAIAHKIFVVVLTAMQNGGLFWIPNYITFGIVYIYQLTFDDPVRRRQLTIGSCHNKAFSDISDKTPISDGTIVTAIFLDWSFNITDENFQDGVNNNSLAYIGNPDAHSFAQPCQRPGYRG